MRTDDENFDLDSMRQKSAEVEALHRIHGLTLRQACELVGIDPNHYIGCNEPLTWIPTPRDIEKMTSPMRPEKERLKQVEKQFLTPPILRGDNA